MSRKKSVIGIFSGVPARMRGIRGKLTQGELAQILGIAQGTVNKYESGAIFPGEDILKKIVEYGGVTVEWLLHGEAEVPWQEIREHAPDIYDAQLLRPLEIDLLTQVLTVVEQLLAECRRLKLTPAQKARLISLLYEHCRENREKPTLHLVEKYLLLAD